MSNTEFTTYAYLTAKKALSAVAALEQEGKNGDLSDYYTKEETNQSFVTSAKLNGYVQSTYLKENYLDSNVVDSTYLKINTALVTYAEKKDLSNYARLEMLDKYLSISDADKNFFSKNDANTLVTIDGLNNTLLNYVPKQDLSTIITQKISELSISKQEAEIIRQQIFTLMRDVRTLQPKTIPSYKIVFNPIRIKVDILTGVKVYSAMDYRIAIGMYPATTVEVLENQPTLIIPSIDLTNKLKAENITLTRAYVQIVKCYKNRGVRNKYLMPTSFSGVVSVQPSDFALNFTSILAPGAISGALPTFNSVSPIMWFEGGNSGNYAFTDINVYSNIVNDPNNSVIWKGSDAIGTYFVYFGQLCYSLDDTTVVNPVFKYDFGIYIMRGTGDGSVSIPMSAISGQFLSLLKAQILDVDYYKDWFDFLLKGVPSLSIDNSSRVKIAPQSMGSIVSYILHLIMYGPTSALDLLSDQNTYSLNYLKDNATFSHQKLFYQSLVSKSRFTSLLIELSYPRVVGAMPQFAVIIDSIWSSNFIRELSAINKVTLVSKPVSVISSPVSEMSTIFDNYALVWAIDVPTALLSTDFLLTIVALNNVTTTPSTMVFTAKNSVVSVLGNNYGGIVRNELIRRNNVAGQLGVVATNIDILNDIAHFLDEKIISLNNTVSQLNETVSQLVDFCKSLIPPKKPMWLQIVDGVLSGLSMLLSAFFPELSFLPKLMGDIIDDIAMKDFTLADEMDIVFDIIGISIAVASKYKTELIGVKDGIKRNLRIGTGATREDVIEMETFTAPFLKYDPDSGSFFNAEGMLDTLSLTNETTLNDSIYTGYSDLPFPPVPTMSSSSGYSCIFVSDYTLVNSPIRKGLKYIVPHKISELPFSDGSKLNWSESNNFYILTIGARAYEIRSPSLYCTFASDSTCILYGLSNRYGPIGYPILDNLTGPTLLGDVLLTKQWFYLGVKKHHSFRLPSIGSSTEGIITIEEQLSYVGETLSSIKVIVDYDGKSIVKESSPRPKTHSNLLMTIELFNDVWEINFPQMSLSYQFFLHHKSIVTGTNGYGLLLDDVFLISNYPTLDTTTDCSLAILQCFSSDESPMSYLYNPSEKKFKLAPLQDNAILFDVKYIVYANDPQSISLLSTNYDRYISSLTTQVMPDKLEQTKTQWELGYIDFQRPCSFLSIIRLTSS